MNPDQECVVHSANVQRVAVVGAGARAFLCTRGSGGGTSVALSVIQTSSDVLQSSNCRAALHFCQLVNVCFI